MKTVIVYASMHHGNTKKLVDAIEKQCGIDVIDAVRCKEIDLSDYELIGFASGIAYGKYYPQLLNFMEKNLPQKKKIFFLHTGGSPREKHNAAVKRIADERGCDCLGTYFCKGFDTYGPFRLVGGIAKGHPNQKEIVGAVQFYKKLGEYANA